MNIVKLSICCVAYNHEAYIRKCLNGFLMQQTNFQFDIVIYDDASTDKTQEIIREYETRYPHIIKPVYQTENQYSKGINPFIRFVFPKVEVEYIAVCEGDDYWTDPHKLQKQVDFLEAHPDYSMCFHNAAVVHEYETTEGDIFSHLKEGEYNACDIVSRFSVPTASVVFRRDVLEKIPRNKNFQVGDNVLWLTCLKHGKIYCLNERMSVYRKVDTGWMKSNEHILPYKIINHSLALKESFPEVEAGIFDKVIIEQYVNLTKSYFKAFDVNLFNIIMSGIVNYHYKYISMFFLSIIGKVAKSLGRKTN